MAVKNIINVRVWIVVSGVKFIRPKLRLHFYSDIIYVYGFRNSLVLEGILISKWSHNYCHLIFV